MKILREPLFHFLLIGATLFVIFDLVSDPSRSGEDRQIVVSAGRIQQFANIFAKTWQRPPTAEELKGLIDDFVLEEIYYRQAVAMGIDRDDTVIRRLLHLLVELPDAIYTVDCAAHPVHGQAPRRVCCLVQASAVLRV